MNPRFVVAAMMVIDDGRPLQWAAYLFGTSTWPLHIAAGGSGVMAAVMIGGMVRPSPSLWPPPSSATALPRGAQVRPGQLYHGPVLYHRGCHSFAASDPLRVLPACILGSGVAGALSMFWLRLPRPTADCSYSGHTIMCWAILWPWLLAPWWAYAAAGHPSKPKRKSTSSSRIRGQEEPLTSIPTLCL